MNQPTPCRCSAENITLYMVMSYSYVTQSTILHAINRTREKSDAHIIGVRDGYRIREERVKVWIEEIMSDHAFSESFRIYHMPGQAGIKY